MNASAALFDTIAAPALVSPGGFGAISGGALRPGSIDQGTFIQQLQAQQAAQQAAREAAGVGGRPIAMTVQPFQNGIPTLSSAQFAALVGPQAASDAGDGLENSPDGEPQAAAMNAARAAPQTPTTQLQTQAAAATPPTLSGLKLSGLPTRSQQNASAASLADADAPATAGTGDDAPSFTRTAAPIPIGEQTAALAEPGAGTKDQTAAKPAPADPKVVHLKQPPDKDMQKDLRTQGKRWVVDETPGARQLFFGADGVFGWDDFVDLINPLQHIPIVAQIYRAITGDQINGAAELLGAIPFGPLGGVGMIGAIADLAVKDVTGKDIGENLEAMVFGDGATTTTPAGADMAATGENPQTGSQTASRAVGFDGDAASRQHDACRG